MKAVLHIEIDFDEATFERYQKEASAAWEAFSGSPSDKENAPRHSHNGIVANVLVKLANALDKDRSLMPNEGFSFEIETRYDEPIRVAARGAAE